MNALLLSALLSGVIGIGQPHSLAEFSNYSCRGKHYCKNISSCAEACYYLKQCGHGQLDRDKDGIPCENVCSSPCP